MGWNLLPVVVRLAWMDGMADDEGNRPTVQLPLQNRDCLPALPPAAVHDVVGTSILFYEPPPPPPPKFCYSLALSSSPSTTTTYCRAAGNPTRILG